MADIYGMGATENCEETVIGGISSNGATQTSDNYQTSGNSQAYQTSESSQTNGTTQTSGDIASAINGTEFKPVGSALPVKTGFWSKVKAVLFQDIDWNREIRVELTPYQQKVEDEVNEFLHQEITWSKVKSFLFKEIKF